MPDNLKKALIGAVVAVALAAAVSYGLISQQTADKIQAETNQTLSNDRSAPQSTPQPAPAPQNSGTQNPGTQAPSPTEPAPQNPAPAPRP